MEHRCSIRKPLSLDVVISCRTLGLVSGRTRNLGVGGMLVDTGRIQLPVNSVVDISLILPEGWKESPFNASAVVIHASKSGVGLMFSDMDQELFERVHQLVSPSLRKMAGNDR